MLPCPNLASNAPRILQSEHKGRLTLLSEVMATRPLMAPGQTNNTKTRTQSKISQEPESEDVGKDKRETQGVQSRREGARVLSHNQSQTDLQSSHLFIQPTRNLGRSSHTRKTVAEIYQEQHPEFVPVQIEGVGQYIGEGTTGQVLGYKVGGKDYAIKIVC
jgi:hypothetical protein